MIKISKLIVTKFAAYQQMLKNIDGKKTERLKIIELRMEKNQTSKYMRERENDSKKNRKEQHEAQRSISKTFSSKFFVFWLSDHIWHCNIVLRHPHFHEYYNPIHIPLSWCDFDIVMFKYMNSIWSIFMRQNLLHVLQWSSLISRLNFKTPFFQMTSR